MLEQPTILVLMIIHKRAPMTRKIRRIRKRRRMIRMMILRIRRTRRIVKVRHWFKGNV